MDDDRERPTPRQSGWLEFKRLAEDAAKRLEDLATARGSPNPILRDPASAAIARHIATRLTRLAIKVEGWKTDPERAATERGPVTTELFELRAEAERILALAPPGPWNAPDNDTRGRKV